MRFNTTFSMATLGACAFAAVLAGRAAATPAPLLEVVGTHEIGDCGGVEVRVVQDEADGVQRFDILTPGLDAEANVDAPRLRRYCNIRAQVAVPPGYRVRPLFLNWQGAADISGLNASANMSGRFYFTGHQGIDGFRRLTEVDTGNFEVELLNGFNQYSSCGGTAEMNFLADITVRAPGGDPAAYSEVKLQRLYGEADEIGRPIYHCGYQIVACH